MNDPQAFQALLRQDFNSFQRKAFQFLNRGTKFHDNWHIDAMVHQLDLARSGQIKKQIFSLPPRCLKSHIASVAWPAFLLGLDPTLPIICVSYADNLALNLSRSRGA